MRLFFNANVLNCSFCEPLERHPATTLCTASVQTSGGAATSEPTKPTTSNASVFFFSRTHHHRGRHRSITVPPPRRHRCRRRRHHRRRRRTSQLVVEVISGGDAHFHHRTPRSRIYVYRFCSFTTCCFVCCRLKSLHTTIPVCFRSTVSSTPTSSRPDLCCGQKELEKE